MDKVWPETAIILTFFAICLILGIKLTLTWIKDHAEKAPQRKEVVRIGFLIVPLLAFGYSALATAMHILLKQKGSQPVVDDFELVLISSFPVLILSLLTYLLSIKIGIAKHCKK